MSTDLPRHLLWLDLETTGLDTATCHVLEVYWELTTWDLAPLASGHGLDPLLGDDGTTWRDRVDHPKVLEMHEASGLAAELDGRHATMWSDMWSELVRLTGLLAGLGGERVALAGAGVASYDRPILERIAPSVTRHLTYWAIDVSPWRRVAQRLDVLGTEHPAHRAKNDVRQAQATYALMCHTITTAHPALTDG